MKLLQQFWLSIVLLVLALLASISYQVIYPLYLKMQNSVGV